MLEDFIACAHTLADKSADVIRGYFRQNAALDVKEDASPVTIADREAEKVMRAYLEEHYPEHGIIGEEFGTKNPDAEYCWVLDPIDGTKSFMIGRPIFGTLIGLAHQGKPILGVINQPIASERWVGALGYGAFFNDSPIHTNPDKALPQAMLATTAHDLLESDEQKQFAKLTEKVQYTNYGGDCYNYGLVASGWVDVVVESGLKVHDFCALAPIVLAAGGCFTDWEGKAITVESEGRVVASGNEVLHQSVLSTLQA